MSPLSTALMKKVSVALHLTLRHNDVLMTSESRKTGCYKEKRPNVKFLPKFLGMCDFDRVSAKFERK